MSYKKGGTAITTSTRLTKNYIYTIAGTGTVTGYTGDGGLATSSKMNHPNGIYVDTIGNVFIADIYNHCIRFISKNGGTYYGITTTANYIYTIAGTGGVTNNRYNYDSNGVNFTNLNYPCALFVDGVGNIFIADTNNNCIRVMINGNVSDKYYAISNTNFFFNDKNTNYNICGFDASLYNKL